MDKMEIDKLVDIELNKRLVKISRIMDSIILGLAVVVESRDNSTGHHIKRTSECVKVFANKLLEKNIEGLDYPFLQRVIKAAPMHDLGKLAVPDRILQKPGRFTDEEFEAIKMHSKEGARLVYEVLSEINDNEFVNISMNIAHYHHEKWNGKGYPTGKAGEDIPVEARIMALADVFDALVSKRCYKEAMSYDEAFGIIEKDLGTHFDPVIGQYFLECRPELEAKYDELLSEE